MSRRIGWIKVYSVVYTASYKNETCWPVFLAGYLSQITNIGVTVEGFVHTHTAYPKIDGGWDTTDLGPSTADKLLFLFPGIKRQYIANENNEIYGFSPFGRKRYIRK